ncbi:MAG TPA: AAA family ATPase [Agriterribacter sp.]|uniref:AAA family ATPase n=1 Tax=Agriterribacter sp. TaxID=2821509 RepID=UPI002CC8C132|nr:AAA family ATPase [Agriterribacter sp.]HRQ17733.1 AAA family ATPase [Agriterribacter sp.]
MQLRKATRTKAKIRLGLSAVSGGGKTYSAILIAKGLCGGLSKVAIIDTENGSADLYSHLGEYNVLPLTAPFTPEKYIEAIKTCEKAGMEVIIIDSITHEWEGKGGCLEIVETLTQASSSKNSYTMWAKVTPRHQAFIDAILQSTAHMITTVRRKQDYEMSKDHNGKTKVEKAGLKEVTRESYEYELTVNLQLDTAHQATASKDRTGLFMGKPEFIPSEDTGRMIADWCEIGIDPEEETKAGVAKLANCNDVDDLKALKETLPAYVLSSEDFKIAATKKYNEVKPVTA